MFKQVISNKTIEKWFKDYYKSLYYFADSYINDSETAKDIVNEVFEQIWNKRKEIDLNTSIKSLLFTMVKNKAINHIRHKEVKNKYYNAEKLKPDIATDTDEAEEHEKLIKRIKQSIEELPPKASDVFKMCFIQNMSYKEIGEELDVSINTVKTHLKKALKRLREEYRDEKNSK